MLAAWKLNCISLVEEAASASSGGGLSVRRLASRRIGAPGGLAGDPLAQLAGGIEGGGVGRGLVSRICFCGRVFAVWAATGVGELQNSTRKREKQKDERGEQTEYQIAIGWVISLRISLSFG